MIKTVLRVYEVTQTFTRNEVKSMIAKKHANEWGHILFDAVASLEKIWHDTPYTFQYELSADCPTHYPFNHSINLDKTTAGTVLINITLTYIQAVEIATDKPDWVAYRNVMYDAHLTDFEKDLLNKI